MTFKGSQAVQIPKCCSSLGIAIEGTNIDLISCKPLNAYKCTIFHWHSNNLSMHTALMLWWSICVTLILTFKICSSLNFNELWICDRRTQNLYFSYIFKIQTFITFARVYSLKSFKLFIWWWILILILLFLNSYMSISNLES